MKTLFFECFSGISGDLNLGAMIDLGVDFDLLKRELSKLGIDEEFSLDVSVGNKMGIHGTRLDVVLHEHEHSHDQNSHSHDGDVHSDHHSHGHTHEGDHVHSHSHSHVHDGMAKPHSHGRSFSDIKRLIQKSNLKETVKELSLAIFEKIAVAEAKVHHQEVEEVHFHEVGATDSIVDIVGAAICFDALNVEKVICTPIELGSGFVWCQHGKLPVPAPATAEILHGIPTDRGGVSGEATTPTGAAILAAIVDDFVENPRFVSKKTGYGIGFKDFEIPNVLRVSLGTIEREFQSDVLMTQERIIETNLDDMNPELIPFIEEELLAIGALDVFRTPIQMKKGRSGVKLSILVGNDKKDQILEYLFTQTSTFGVRSFVVDKMMMKREYEMISTEFGEVQIKKAILNGKVVKYKPEFEDIKRISKETKIPINDVQNRILKLYEKIRRVD